MSAIYRYDITVPASAIDENEHLNNVTYVQWMQTVAIAHANHTICAQATAEAGCTWVVRAHQVEYLRPAFEGEKIAVLTWISSVRKVRAQRKYKFFRVSDQAILATGETDWVFADASTGRPRAIPPAVATAFPIITDENAPTTLPTTP
ncbi:MAG: thioesterase family protein [Cyanobacteria bacterium P01_F01_bin.53]